MYSSEDLELFSISEYTMKAWFRIVERRKCLKRIFFQYLTEAMPKGISIEQFCSHNRAPYNIFYKWYKESANRMQSSLLELLRCGLSNLRTLATCLWRTDQKAITFTFKKLWTAQKQNKKYINTL